LVGSPTTEKNPEGLDWGERDKRGCQKATGRSEKRRPLKFTRGPQGKANLGDPLWEGSETLKDFR